MWDFGCSCFILKDKAMKTRKKIRKIRRKFVFRRAT